jgi:hypothetical protein
MVFSDDSTIKLSENTKLEIKEFLFKKKSRRGVFSLAIGKMTADVKKYIGGDNVFEVQSPTVVVGVRGTGFEFDEALKDGNVDSKMATVACTEGSLYLSALDPKGEVVSTAVLEAGQMAVIIGGVITISAIGAAAAATAVSQTTETGTAGAAGGTGTGTGGATGGSATTGTADTAAGTSTGISKTTWIVGGAVAAGVALGAVALGSSGGGGGGGGSSSSSGGSTTPTTTTPTTPTSCTCNPSYFAGLDPVATCTCLDPRTFKCVSPTMSSTLSLGAVAGLTNYCAAGDVGFAGTFNSDCTVSLYYYYSGDSYHTSTCTWPVSTGPSNSCLEPIARTFVNHCLH